jgi:hypothetical protein
VSDALTCTKHPYVKFPFLPPARQPPTTLLAFFTRRWFVVVLVWFTTDFLKGRAGPLRSSVTNMRV